MRTLSARERICRPAAQVALLLCFAAQWALAVSDVVEFRPEEGKRAQLIGEIKEETWEAVQIECEMQGEKKIIKVPAELIIRVLHGQKPADFAAALGALEGGDFAGAYDGFLKAAKAAEEQDSWVKPYALFSAAEAAFNQARYVAAGQDEKAKYYARAEEQYGALTDQFSRHRLVPAAELQRAICLMRLGQVEKSSDLLDSIELAGYREDVKLKAQIWSARVLTEQKNNDKAIEKLAKLREDIPEEQVELRYQAMLAEAYARQGKDQLREAEALFWTVGLRSDDEELQAEALISRGLSLKSRGNLREALYSFLRVIVLHFRVTHEYQRALYHAALVAQELYPEKAKELARELYNKFPKSYWAKNLKEETQL